MARTEKAINKKLWLASASWGLRCSGRFVRVASAWRCAWPLAPLTGPRACSALSRSALCGGAQAASRTPRPAARPGDKPVTSRAAGPRPVGASVRSVPLSAPRRLTPAFSAPAFGWLYHLPRSRLRAHPTQGQRVRGRSQSYPWIIKTAILKGGSLVTTRPRGSRRARSGDARSPRLPRQAHHGPALRQIYSPRPAMARAPAPGQSGGHHRRSHRGQRSVVCRAFGLAGSLRRVRLRAPAPRLPCCGLTRFAATRPGAFCAAVFAGFRSLRPPTPPRADTFDTRARPRTGHSPPRAVDSGTAGTPTAPPSPALSALSSPLSAFPAARFAARCACTSCAISARLHSRPPSSSWP